MPEAAKDQSCQQRKPGCKSQDPPVEPERNIRFSDVRKGIGACDQQGTRSNQAKRDSHHAAKGTEKQALNDELAQYPAASRPDGSANRELALADCHPHQQKISQVCTSNEENKNHRALQEQEGRAHIAHHRITVLSQLKLEV